MNEEIAAKCLSELGSPTRLAVFRLLVRAGPDGMVVGGIQRRLGIPAHGWSTIDIGASGARNLTRAMVPVLVDVVGQTVRRKSFPLN